MKKYLYIVIKIIAIAVLAGSVCFSLYQRAQKNKAFDYGAVLDEVAFSVDGNVKTFRDMAFYIANQERIVEEEALIYNRKSSKDYWNMHTNGQFIAVAAKDAVYDMAVHDTIMYDLAVSEGIRLSKEQEKEVENSIMDFWMDLLDDQEEKLLSYTTKEAVDEAIYKKAVAEVYQDYLAVVNNHAYVYYDVDADGYEDIKKEHKIEKSKIWKDVVMGEITIHHDKVNYATGFEHE